MSGFGRDAGRNLLIGSLTMKRLMTLLPALARLAALMALYSFDLLDLYAKVAWIGPSESFSFKVVHEHSFEHEPLPRPAFVSTTGSSFEVPQASGWTSLYNKCADLYATKNNINFDLVKATNCDLGASFAAERHVIPELVLSARPRADSVAWVSCQLLFFHRRPPICQDNVVTLFPQRYLLIEHEVDHEMMAPINSKAEAELLRMLNLLSRSYPLSKVVCAQGFESTTGPGHYDATVFICGSPNFFESASIGVHTPTFAHLHETLAWLAVNKVNIMGFELVARQNARLRFTLHEKDGEIVVAEEIATNFVTFGHFYVVLVITDIVLLVFNVRATIDTARMFGWGELLGFIESDEKRSSSSKWLLLYRSLYRSGPIAKLTMFSALVSWLVDSPFAVMWCNNSDTKEYALLFATRMWMLVLCLVNSLWSVFVQLSEAQAYKFARRTFVSPVELVVISAFVVISERGCFEARCRLARQQILDDNAFLGRVALANAYSEDLDGFATTPPQVVYALFAPLMKLVGKSLALVAVMLIVKAFYYRRRLLQQRRVSIGSVAVIECDNIDEHLTNGAVDQRFSATPLLPCTKSYHRLPLEKLLRIPARANSLVRCCFDVDEVENDRTYMLPHVYFDFGIVVSDAGFLRTRGGFLNVLHRRIDVEIFFVPMESPTSASPLSLKRQRVGDGYQVKSAMSSMPCPVDGKASSPSPTRTLSEVRPTLMSRFARRRRSMEDMLETSPSFI